MLTDTNEENYVFPHPESSDKEGLLMMGGTLSAPRVLQAYSQGIFPWYGPGSPILWWSPNPRLILIPKEFKLSKSLKKSLKKPYKLTTDTAFEQVINACATCSDRSDNTWITPEMIQVYIELHNRGYAHSVEIWQDDELTGGLYGLSLGRAFFGESMFHKATDSSKIALYYLSQMMEHWSFDFIDCQIPSKHLQNLGAKIIGRKEFLRLLNHALEHPTKQGVWNYQTETINFNAD